MLYSYNSVSYLPPLSIRKLRSNWSVVIQDCVTIVFIETLRFITDAFRTSIIINIKMHDQVTSFFFKKYLQKSHIYVTPNHPTNPKVINDKLIEQKAKSKGISIYILWCMSIYTLTTQKYNYATLDYKHGPKSKHYNQLTIYS